MENIAKLNDFIEIAFPIFALSCDSYSSIQTVSLPVRKSDSKFQQFISSVFFFLLHLDRCVKVVVKGILFEEE